MRYYQEKNFRFTLTVAITVVDGLVSFQRISKRYRENVMAGNGTF